MTKRMIAVSALAAVAVLVGCGSTQRETAQPPAPEAVAVETTPATTTPKAEPEKPELTVAQENAIEAAKDYLDMTAFSRKGLIKQLSSEYGEGFSVKDATFAVDHVKVDWNEQAARSAKEYLELDSFSRGGLIRQLESPYGEQFTHSQAVYGVEAVGL